MIKFFRKIRQKLLAEGKTGKYFKYAIGEIFLVVIGILIALSINNWNQQIEDEAKITSILKEIQNDILIDLETSNMIFDYHVFTDSVAKNILNNKYTAEDIKDIDFIPIGYNYRDFKTTTNGFDNLSNNLDKIPEKYKHLLPEVKNLYISLKTTIDVYNVKIRSTVYTNVDDLAGFNWYQDYLKNELNNEAIDYFLNDVKYKNLVGAYMGYRSNIFQISNEYRVKAIDLYLEIHKAINSTTKIPEIVNYKSKSSNNYIGSYRLKETVNPDGIWDANLKIVARNEELVIVFPENNFELKLLAYANKTFFPDELFYSIITFDSPEKGNLYISQGVNTYAIYERIKPDLARPK
ncbi:DUF6090 family protein [Polaribacter sp. P097]|uniref:DUF6090 family protein n=1 Tax=Polaribacter sp. P097 TaxID=3117398 RepID=UPI002FDF732C